MTPIAASLVVPMRNEAPHLHELIESIKGQTLAPAEVVLVDGGSTDGTVAVARRLTGDDPRFRVVEAGDATPGRGRNVGIAAARHEWVALTDAGIRLEPDWLEALVEQVVKNPDAGIVYGVYYPIEETFFERCATLAYVAALERRPEGMTRGRFVASSIVRRTVWEAAGGFPDLRAAEDLMFTERVLQAGFREAWAPRARVWWRLRPTLAETAERFLVFSRHNALAGRQRYWHYGVARLYAVGAACAVLAIAVSGWFLAVPLVAGAARVTRRIWQRRGAHGVLWCLNPVQFALVALILVVTDLATLAGWLQASVQSRRGVAAPETPR